MGDLCVLTTQVVVLLVTWRFWWPFWLSAQPPSPPASCNCTKAELMVPGLFRRAGLRLHWRRFLTHYQEHWEEAFTGSWCSSFHLRKWIYPNKQMITLNSNHLYVQSARLSTIKSLLSHAWKGAEQARMLQMILLPSEREHVAPLV